MHSWFCVLVSLFSVSVYVSSSVQLRYDLCPSYPCDSFADATTEMVVACMHAGAAVLCQCVTRMLEIE